MDYWRDIHQNSVHFCRYMYASEVQYRTDVYQDSVHFIIKNLSGLVVMLGERLLTFSRVRLAAYRLMNMTGTEKCHKRSPGFK